MLKIGENDIDTVEGAEKYLKEQGVNMDAIIEHAVRKLKLDKAYDTAKYNGQVPEGYCRCCKNSPCDRLGITWPGEDED